MRYFLTGATGFIGGRIARQLLRAGHEVVALARSPAKAQDLQVLGVTVHAGDITDRESLRAPMAGVDGVFHIAAWYKVGARDRHVAEHINVEGTRNVLEMMREQDVPKGVYTSTLAVFSDTHGRLADESYHHDGPWLSEYDRTKWKAHYEVARPMIEAGLPLVIVQPGLVYGPGDTGPAHDVLHQFLQRKMPLLPRRTAYCWGHVEDTARGHLLAMERGVAGQSYIIAGPPHSLIETIQLAEQLSGVRAPRLRAPPLLLKLASVLMRPLDVLVTLPESYTPEYLRVAAGATYLGSSAKARRELGFETRPLHEGLRETLAYEMRQLGMPLPSAF